MGEGRGSPRPSQPALPIAAATAFSQLMLVMGLAPILAPVAGALEQSVDLRGLRAERRRGAGGERGFDIALPTSVLVTVPGSVPWEWP